MAPVTHGITVRLADKADAQAIHALVVELAQARGMPDKVVSSPADIARDGFGDEPAFEALLAERDGRPVGLCLFFGSYSSWRGRRGIYVLDLVVTDSARASGVGRRLLAETAALAKARGATYLRLSVDDDNVTAQRFYRGMGLRHSTPEQIFVLENDALDALAAGARGSST